MKKHKYRVARLSALAGSVVCGFFLISCDIDKVEDGEAPKVDIDPGKLPKYDVDAPEVEIGTKKVEVVVPDVKINPPKDDDKEAPGGEESEN